MQKQPTLLSHSIHYRISKHHRFHRGDGSFVERVINPIYLPKYTYKMCLICGVIGIQKIILRPKDPKLKDWIDGEEDESREAIWAKIRKNITYYLGNAVQFASLRKAAEFLFERDYKGKKQIFVPEEFLTKAPQLITNEKKELERLLKTVSDEKEKGNWRCRLKSIEGEKLEKNVYDTLKSYFKSHSDQEVLVLHGFEIADLDKLPDHKDIAHWEKDFLIINVTYGYILNIEAKSSLNGKSLTKAKEQLENTKRILEKWFGADLTEGWKFISAIYCERNDKTNKNCRNADMDFIFTGTEDLKGKIDKIHEGLQDERRFD